MKYKNIVFDFGNVIGTFNGREIIRSFVTDETDVDYLCDLIYAHWAELDSGAIDYQEYRNEILRTIPERLYDPVDLFFREWPGCAKPLPQTLAFVRELKERGIPVYLLSNAPTYFADYMKDHEILKPFDGILFSAPIHMAKPDQEIYEYFFRKFDLNPSECFFIDDLEKISRERKMPVWTESSLPVISRQ
ncbi:HAD family hydrolase [Dorea longicatena]|uniref:HAD family hydrolase n=1 Tax=Dorea longicatena TaxID=88431 RepID=UPI001FAA1870|nr:HAD-IA family hydrolase [Dorea longicatena]